MNRDLIVSRDESWDVLPHLDAIGPRTGQDFQSGMDLSRLIRILREWRSVILTTPMYRARVVLEANPPSVQVIDDQSESSNGPSMDTWQFVATQLGLLQSRGLAERVAQDLGLANNPQFATQDADPAKRVRQAADKIADNLQISPQADGQLIRFAFIWESPDTAAKVANAYAEAFINASLQRRYEASAYARNFLQRQIATTRRELEKSERQLVHYAQQQGIIDTGTGGGAEGQRNSDASSPQGQSLIALNQALAEAVAEFTWGLILAVTRRICEGDRLVRRGEWKGWALDFMLGTELRGKQLGLIGRGRIGTAGASRAPAIGMRAVFAATWCETRRHATNGRSHMLHA